MSTYVYEGEEQTDRSITVIYRLTKTQHRPTSLAARLKILRVVYRRPSSKLNVKKIDCRRRLFRVDCGLDDIYLVDPDLPRQIFSLGHLIDSHPPVPYRTRTITVPMVHFRGTV